jgi:predicted alpha/beta-fold hydrolase
MLWVLDQIGWRGVLMHFRGCSGEPNRLPRSYHSGDTADLAAVVETILNREPSTPVAAVGYSLGGNVLLKWLGETGAQNPLITAVAVSVPFDLYSTVQRLQTGFSRVYQRYLLKSLITSAKKKFSLISSPIELQGIEKLNTFHLYDEHVTAPLHGFNSATEYYTKTSSRQFLKTIRIPTLILQAKDDPFLYPQAIPAAEELSPTTILELSDKGGHVGFVSGTLPWQAVYWLEQRIPEFLAEHV